MIPGSITRTNLGAQEWFDSPRSQSRQGSQSTERTLGKCKMLMLFTLLLCLCIFPCFVHNSPNHLHSCFLLRKHKILVSIHNPANPFPVFVNQDASRDRSDYVREGGRFYDDTLERRARGAGFYAFSQNEEERERQMKELLELRSEVGEGNCLDILQLWIVLRNR